MQTGRPRKYKSPEEFNAMVDDYIEWCGINQEPITWTGLALHLGFCSRVSIDEYLKYDGFSYSVKRAKMLVENAYEKRLSGNSPTGAIFALKNFNWQDKAEPLDTESKPAPVNVNIQVKDARLDSDS